MTKGWCYRCYHKNTYQRTVPFAKRYPELDEGPCNYQAAHRRVVRAKGRAADHACACGSTAKQWSYLGGSPDEQRGTVRGPGTMPLRWCGDPAYYLAECNPCHKRRDGAQRIADRVLLFSMLDEASGF